MIKSLTLLIVVFLTMLIIGSTMIIYDLSATRIGTTPGGTLYFYTFNLTENETTNCIITTQGGISFSWE